MNNTYEVGSELLRKYANAYAKAMGESKEILLKQIPREENNKTNKLTKMASSLTNWTSTETIV